jgi:hypothetical protein
MGNNHRIGCVCATCIPVEFKHRESESTLNEGLANILPYGGRMWTPKKLINRKYLKVGRWTDLEKDAVCSLARDGWSTNKIAYFLDRNQSRVATMLKENKSVIFAHDVS